MNILVWPPPLLLLLTALVAPATAATTYRPDWNRLRGLARGRVEVKAFVTQDIPLYHNLVMKHLPGADPELVLLSRNYQELERIPLSEMTRDEINKLVQELGFYRKSAPDAQVPPEHLWAPAKPPEDASERADL
ncbi:selenoprotein M isoform X2 [Phodopus roborovskii]|uniref:selenoprotein M isoform X2 n=1 Tax=Phodopus roborovskii TaxID=109678 RepID=UPI0021E4D759|nr:selenoprotein M isoform X2 [Phodopus roborovskii]